MTNTPPVPDNPEVPDNAEVSGNAEVPDDTGMPAQELTAREKATARNKKQAWLYIVIGVVLGVVAVLGLMADDRGALDWALLVLAIVNLGIGVMAVRRPEPRITEPTDN